MCCGRISRFAHEGLPGLPGGSQGTKRFAWWVPALGVMTLAIAVACFWLRSGEPSCKGSGEDKGRARRRSCR